jgi:hypothetical protein
MVQTAIGIINDAIQVIDALITYIMINRKINSHKKQSGFFCFQILE